jgi:hypothetical protein
MIHLVPRSLCSWDFSATGLSSGTASVEYNWASEQGRILAAPASYEIRKHGVFSGHWTLEHAGSVVAEAHKPSAMFRSFEVTDGGTRLTIRAESALSRVFEIEAAQRVIGRVRPDHAFTRRSTLDCPDSVPEHIQLFAFWLAALTWRRAANNNSGA